VESCVRWIIRLAFTGLVLLSPALARATPPCKPGSGIEEKSGKERFAQVQWVATGKIARIEHHVEPYANCALEDRSKCAQFNAARIIFKVEMMEKGKAPASRELELHASYCARSVPVDLDTRPTYRFFGDDESFFVTFEAIPDSKAKNAK
jgi:hypothetical protein